MICNIQQEASCALVAGLPLSSACALSAHPRYLGLLAQPGSKPSDRVAVKLPGDSSKLSSGETVVRTRMMTEAALMAQFQHQNVVKLLGVVTRYVELGVDWLRNTLLRAQSCACCAD